VVGLEFGLILCLAITGAAAGAAFALGFGKSSNNALSVRVEHMMCFCGAFFHSG